MDTQRSKEIDSDTREERGGHVKDVKDKVERHSCFSGIHILNTNCFICAAVPIWQNSLPLSSLPSLIFFSASFASLHCEFYIDINKCSCHRLPFHYVALFFLFSLHFFFVRLSSFAFYYKPHNALIRRGLLENRDGGNFDSIGSSWFLKNKLLPGERLL